MEADGNVVLVTGGAGFIGSHACRHLAEAGFLPVTYDNLSRGFEMNVRWGPFEKGDLRDVTKLVDVLKRHRPVAVMHFAAFAYVEESTRQALEYYENNVGGALSLLRAMREAKIARLISSSSCATYGHVSVDMITEQNLQSPINPYGWTKFIVERAIEDASREMGLRYVHLRYFNAAGADSNGEIGEDHEPETHLIPLVLRAALTKDSSIRINGTDYCTPDGTCIRDYIHVDDLAAAHVLALKYLLQSNPSIALNLGLGRGYSVLEVILEAQKITGRTIATETAPRRAGDPAVLVSDASLARRTLGWEPQKTSLTAMIEDAWKWQLKRFAESKHQCL